MQQHEHKKKQTQQLEVKSVCLLADALLSV